EGPARALTARGEAVCLFLVPPAPPALFDRRDGGARHECLFARASQDDDPDRVVALEVFYVVGHELPHVQADGVALLRLVEDDPADRAVLLEQQLGRLAHDVLLVGGWLKPTVRRAYLSSHTSCIRP